MIRIDSELEWKYTYFKSDTYFKSAKMWFAFCEQLKISQQIPSQEELKQDMLECVDNLFNQLAKRGELKGYLEKHGWVLKGTLPKTQTKSTVDMSVRFERVEEHDLQEAIC